MRARVRSPPRRCCSPGCASWASAFPWSRRAPSTSSPTPAPSAPTRARWPSRSSSGPTWASTPGVDFGAAGEGWLRFCYAASEATIEEALERLARVLPELAVKILGAEMDRRRRAGRRSSRPARARGGASSGRSNVGKSSLLNRLVQRKKLARTSGTPGKTRLIHWYRVRAARAARRCFVDLPGYGFAQVSKAERERWQRLVEAYLEGRETLRCAVLLQDLRRDWSEDEDAADRVAARARDPGDRSRSRRSTS